MRCCTAKQWESAGKVYPIPYIVAATVVIYALYSIVMRSSGASFKKKKKRRSSGAGVATADIVLATAVINAIVRSSGATAGSETLKQILEVWHLQGLFNHNTPSTAIVRYPALSYICPIVCSRRSLLPLNGDRSPLLMVVLELTRHNRCAKCHIG
jgi:hypothetical protein